jgi:hypothetical protein
MGIPTAIKTKNIDTAGGLDIRHQPRKLILECKNGTHVLPRHFYDM